MTFTPLRASLLALALFGVAAPATAATDGAGGTMLLAQAETQDFEAIRKFLAGGRDVAALGDDRLQQRLNRARKLRETEGLPPELDQALQQEIAQLTAEVERRQQAAAAPAEPEAAQPEQPVQEAQPKPEPQPEVTQQAPAPEATPAAPQPAQEQAQVQAQPEQAPAQPAAEAQPSSGSDEVTLFLQSVRPASELSADELRQQMRQATRLSKIKRLPPEQRRALRDVIRDARAAMKDSNRQAEAPPAETAPQPQAEAPAKQPEVQQQTAQPQQPTQQQIQTPMVDPQVERQAQAILNDKTDVRTLKRRELRQRLSTIRDLLATNQMSPGTREALRRKLADERQVLRSEVSRSEDGGQQPAQQGGGTSGGSTTNNNTTANTTVTNNNVTINNNTTVTNNDVRVALNDRRPPSELEEDELVRRIDIYRDVVEDEDYAEEERRAWRRQMERDRRYLRQRMIEERREREARLRAGQYEFNIEIEDEWDPGEEIPDDVFAAEVEDEEIAEVLTAPPRRKVQRRYSVEEFEHSAEARDAVARIEIDTVHFGFGEGFLREEEIDKLDRVAQVLERILAKNPDEVFLLEGHTDAVGSDAANLRLSRERAQAVKEALTTYYVIPAENLKTVGLGERYLKIPTTQAEAENRRVSLARITALVGQAD